MYRVSGTRSKIVLPATKHSGAGKRRRFGRPRVEATTSTVALQLEGSASSTRKFSFGHVKRRRSRLQGVAV